MSEVYKIFADEWKHVLDFSDEALLELYNHESYGGNVSQKNGYAHGKKWLNLCVTMWKEDIAQGLLFKHELYEKDHLPRWWLDSVLKDVYDNYHVWKSMKDKS